MDINLSEWFSVQLKASADGFVWAAEQVPTERREIKPPVPLGEWPLARHVFHMFYYERECALPHMHSWLDGPLLSVEEINKKFMNEDEASRQHESIEQMLSEFKRVRAEQIALLPRFSEALWHEVHASVWGPVSMKWIVSKTFQHTAEHTHDVMRMALFWDRIVAWERAQQQQ